MKDLKIEGLGHFRCLHLNQFPPAHVHPIIIRERGTPDQQRQDKLITDAEYNRCLVWQRVCGLMEMGNKCLDCDLCMVVTKDSLQQDKTHRLQEDNQLKAKVFQARQQGQS